MERVAFRPGRFLESLPGGARMSFEHPWVLLALLLPLGWAAWEWRETGRRLALALKAATFLNARRAKVRCTVMPTTAGNGSIGGAPCSRFSSQ